MKCENFLVVDNKT